MSQKPTLTVDDDSEPKVRGRKVTPIDADKVLEMLRADLPLERIGDYFNVTTKTLYRRFGDLIHQENVQFELDLRRGQKELADKGDRHMLIHLGKVRLAQKEAAEPIADVQKDLTFNLIVATKPKD